MDDILTIGSGRLVAGINPLGAELWFLRDEEGRDLLWDGNPAFWSGRAPLLFPVVGETVDNSVRVDGRAYPMPRHGFARRCRFEVRQAEPERALLVLRADEQTRTHYPFDFELQLRFEIEDASLSIEALIANTGERPMPASFGFHPAFAWPLPYDQPRAAHRIVFGSPEPDPIAVLDADGLIAGTRASPLEGRTLHLADALFSHDALIWDPVHSRAVTYGAEDGPQIELLFPDSPQLGIWTKPGAPFVCIEPWNGHADPQGYAGELRDKPGVFAVQPGDTRAIALRVTLTR